jgi:hypothetical protein
MCLPDFFVSTATFNCNFLVQQAYNITKQRSYVVLKVGDKEQQTTVGLGEHSTSTAQGFLHRLPSNPPT